MTHDTMTNNAFAREQADRYARLLEAMGRRMWVTVLPKGRISVGGSEYSAKTIAVMADQLEMRLGAPVKSALRSTVRD